MARTTAYSMINVVATLDRKEIQAPWDGDDAIVVTTGGDRGTGLIGAAGDGIFSVSADQSATISIKLMHTSPTHRLLEQKLKQQQARGGNFPGFSFTVKDRSSGEGGAADRCYIRQAPNDSKGKNATVREWMLWAALYDRNIPDA